MESKQFRSNFIWGGAALLAIAVAAFIFLGQSGDEVGCALSTAGVGAIAEGLTHGRGTAEIVGPAAATAVVPVACKKVVEKLVEEPKKEVELTVESPAGGEAKQSTSGYELEETAAVPESSEAAGSTVLQHSLDCYSSYGSSEFLNQMCLEGLIAPS